MTGNLLQLLPKVAADLCGRNDVVHPRRLGEGDGALGQVVLEVGISLELGAIGVAKEIALVAEIASESIVASNGANRTLADKVISESLAGEGASESLVTIASKASKRVLSATLASFLW